MNYRDRVAFIFLMAFAFLLGVYPHSTQIVVGFISILAFLGFQAWLTKEKHDDLDEMRTQIKSLKDKVDGLTFKKGLMG